MSPRQRKGRSKGLPPNLFAQKDARSGATYYRYRDTRGKWHGMGTDRREAIRQAGDANMRALAEPAQLWQRITGEGLLTVSEWCDTFERMEGERKQAENTRRSLASRLRRIRRGLGHHALPELTTRHCAEFLDGVREEGKERLSQALRSTLKQMLNEAIAAGHIERNVAAVTRYHEVTEKRARLTLDTFRQIHSTAASLDAWLQRAMELALVTGQPREVVAHALFADVHDEALWITRGKTGARIMIPLDLRLHAVDWSVGDVVRACRDAVVSRNLIHHSKPRTKSKPGDPVHMDTISRRFARARELAGVTGEKPPTFHEIRSLSERLYRDQGVDTQALLGHKDPRTTAIYNDARGSEWIRVRVD